MNKTIFGKTGKNVTWLGMGGMRFEKEIPEKECIASIRYANELGINYFDTAPIYNEDRSEDIYGKAFSKMPRDQFLVATKGENEKSAKEIEKSIERSLKRLKVDQIDFYFLWCVIHPDQFEKAQMKGRSLEAIMKAKVKGQISHVGASIHMYTDDIKKMVDSGLFEFIMIPYNALNFKAREEGLRYAKKHNLGTIVMNPLYGGVIPSFRDIMRIYSDSNNSPVEDALRFCLESPFIDVTLSGMNSKEGVKENIEITGRARKKTVKEQNETGDRIKSTHPSMCTSCNYCLSHCPEEINISSFMEIYNTYMLTGDKNSTRERYNWYTQFGPLYKSSRKAADCTQCGACEEECTQYLNIIERLEWIKDNLE